MSIVTSFSFNAFQENTYVVHDASKEAIVIDPGCHSLAEQELLCSFIENRNLNVKMVVNTHCHLDHVFGNKFACETFNVGLYIHRGELDLLNGLLQVARLYGLEAEASPAPTGFIGPDQPLAFGETSLQIFFTPGHSPASLSFYSAHDKYIIGGDVLFKSSIGRTDLPGGDYDTLIQSINDSFMSLSNDTIVYPGHGPSTTIGEERTSNPFLAT